MKTLLNPLKEISEQLTEIINERPPAKSRAQRIISSELYKTDDAIRKSIEHLEFLADQAAQNRH